MRFPANRTCTGSVGQFLDTSYDVVKKVYDNLDIIGEVAQSIEVDEHYLGYHAIAPTLRDDGSPLEGGDYYVDSVNHSVAFYDSNADLWIHLTSEDLSTYIATAQEAAFNANTSAESAAASVDEMAQLVEDITLPAATAFSFTALEGQTAFILEPSFGDNPTVLSVSINGREQDSVGSGGDSPSYTVEGRVITLVNPVAEQDKLTGIASLANIESTVVIANKVVDIRDYGAVMDNPAVDSTDALLQAIQKGDTTLVQGGTYYIRNTIITSKCTLRGGGTFAPFAGSVDTGSLLTFEADRNKVSDIHFDMLGSGIAPTRFNGDDNYISHISGRNMVVTATTFTSASLVLITGSHNKVSDLFGQDLVNLGANSNPSVPRVITITGGANHNTATNITGKNIAGGCIHGTGYGNVLDTFSFDNGDEGSAEMRNGIYSLAGSEYFTVQNGSINKCSQPIVDQGIGNIYKNITEIDSGADGIQNSTDVLFDSITKVFNDKTFKNGGFLRSRASNVVSTGVTVRNCSMTIPCHYTSIFTFDVGSVDNLKVEGNIFTTEAVDGVAFSNIVLHASGKNPIYTCNTFNIRNFGVPFADLRSWLIRFPANVDSGKWIDNTLTSEADNGVIRVVGVLSSSSVLIDDNNQLRADIGSAYLQSGYVGRFLDGIAPPNAGVWTAGDTIRNISVNLNPSVGYEHQKYQFFVCVSNGEFGSGVSPTFRLVNDLSSENVAAPIEDSGLGALPLNNRVVGGTAQTLYESYSSANKDLILLGGFNGSLYKTVSTAVEATPITSPVNTYYSVYGLEGSDSGNRVFVSGASYVGYSISGGDGWVESVGLNYLGFDDINMAISCDSTGNTVLACYGERGSSSLATLNDIYLSTDGGVSFINKGIFNNSAGYISNCHIAKENTGKMFLVTKGTDEVQPMFGMSLDGNTWTSQTLNMVPIGMKAYCVDSNKDGSIVFIGMSVGRLLKSTDGGTTFSEVVTGSSENIRTISVSRDGMIVVLGTNEGGYLRSTDGGLSFVLAEYVVNGVLRGLSINSDNNLMIGVSSNGTYIQSEVS